MMSSIGILANGGMGGLEDGKEYTHTHTHTHIYIRTMLENFSLYI